MVNAEFCLRNCSGNHIFGYREPPREPPIFRFWSVPAFRNPGTGGFSRWNRLCEGSFALRSNTFFFWNYPLLWYAAVRQ